MEKVVNDSILNQAILQVDSAGKIITDECDRLTKQLEANPNRKFQRQVIAHLLKVETDIETRLFYFRRIKGQVQRLMRLNNDRTKAHGEKR